MILVIDKINSKSAVEMVDIIESPKSIDEMIGKTMQGA